MILLRVGRVLLLLLLGVDRVLGSCRESGLRVVVLHRSECLLLLLLHRDPRRTLDPRPLWARLLPSLHARSTVEPVLADLLLELGGEGGEVVERVGHVRLDRLGRMAEQVGRLGHSLPERLVVLLLRRLVASPHLLLLLKLNLGRLMLLLLSELGLRLRVHRCVLLGELRHGLLRRSLLTRRRLTIRSEGGLVRKCALLLVHLRVLVGERLLLLERHLHRSVPRDEPLLISGHALVGGHHYPSLRPSAHLVDSLLLLTRHRDDSLLTGLPCERRLGCDERGRGHLTGRMSGRVQLRVRGAYLGRCRLSLGDILEDGPPLPEEHGIKGWDQRSIE